MHSTFLDCRELFCSAVMQSLVSWNKGPQSVQRKTPLPGVWASAGRLDRVYIPTCTDSSTFDWMTRYLHWLASQVTEWVHLMKWLVWLRGRKKIHNRLFFKYSFFVYVNIVATLQDMTRISPNLSFEQPRFVTWRTQTEKGILQHACVLPQMPTAADNKHRCSLSPVRHQQNKHGSESISVLERR